MKISCGYCKPETNTGNETFLSSLSVVGHNICITQSKDLVSRKEELNSHSYSEENLV